MKHKTFMLFELFLVVFAFYAMLKYTGSLRLFVPFVCLVTVLVAGKVETSLTDRSSKEDRQGNDRGKEDKKKTKLIEKKEVQEPKKDEKIKKPRKIEKNYKRKVKLERKKI